MLKTRDELAADLYALRVSVPHWRRLLSRDDFLTHYHGCAERLVAWATVDDRDWLQRQLELLLRREPLREPPPPH